MSADLVAQLEALGGSLDELAAPVTVAEVRGRTAQGLAMVTATASRWRSSPPGPIAGRGGWSLRRCWSSVSELARWR